MDSEVIRLERSTRNLQDALADIGTGTLACDIMGIYADFLPVKIATTVCLSAILIASIVVTVLYYLERGKLDIASDKYNNDHSVSQFDLRDGILASKTNYENSLIFYEWATESLDKINYNIVSQNNAMAKLLQDRHNSMETRLNQYMACSKFLSCDRLSLYVCKRV